MILGETPNLPTKPCLKVRAKSCLCQRVRLSCQLLSSDMEAYKEYEVVEVKFKERKKVVFLGSLRAEMDEKTQKELQGHILVKRRLVEGNFFYHYADGSIEIRPLGEVMEEMCKEIRRRK